MKTVNEFLDSKQIYSQDLSFSEDGIKGFICIDRIDMSFVASWGGGWDHVSVAPLKKKIVPSWDMMCKVKDVFFKPDEPVIQMNHLRKKDGTVYSRFYNRRGTYYPDRLPQFWFVVWNKVFKAEFLEGIRFIEGLQHGEDELFVLNCLAKSRRIYCSDRIHMVHCFDNPQSLSKTVNVEDLIAEQRALLNFAECHADDGELLDAVRQRQVYLWDNKVYTESFKRVH